MNKEPQRFLKTWLVTCMVLALIAGSFNAAIDPYLVLNVPRINGLNARKPAAETTERLMKAYDVLRSKPNTLLLGASRVDWGMDAQDPSWPVEMRPVYNLGFADGHPYLSFRYLQHVLSQQRVDLVVVGLDFEYFAPVFEENRLPEPDVELRLSVTKDGSANVDQKWQHVRDLLRATLSLDALTDSAATLAANFSKSSVDLVGGNVNVDVKRRHFSRAGSYPLVAAETLAFTRLYRASRRKHRTDSFMADLRAILDLCESHGTRVVLFISPVHAALLDIMEFSGYWLEFENWKRELVLLTEEYSNSNSLGHVPLWDFSGYHKYATEEISLDGRVMHWFVESAHYSKALAHLIVERIVGGGNVDFGVLLSSKNIEPHLAVIREQRRIYREHRQKNVIEVRDLYEAVAGSSPAILSQAQRRKP